MLPSLPLRLPLPAPVPLRRPLPLRRWACTARVGSRAARSIRWATSSHGACDPGDASTGWRGEPPPAVVDQCLSGQPLVGRLQLPSTEAAAV